jgi:hypothetical protein
MLAMLPRLCIIIPLIVAAVDPKKSNAVTKVIEVLSNLQRKVQKEGQEEIATFFKYERFCNETTLEKQKSILDLQAKSTELKALIAVKAARAATAANLLQTKQADIESSKQSIIDAEKTRATERTNFEAANKELATAIKALDKAVDGIRNSKEASFLQLPEDVRNAAMLADAMGLGSSELSSLLESEQTLLDDPPKVKFDFHSSGIVGTLENLQEKFRTAKTSASQEEMRSRQAHLQALQAKELLLQSQTREAQAAEVDKKESEGGKASAERDLAKTQADLLDDQTYLKDLTSMCTQKKATFIERQAVRANEISALSSATKILQKGMKPVANKTAASMVAQESRLHAVDMDLLAVAAESPLLLENAEVAAEALEAKDRQVRIASFLQKTSNRHFEDRKAEFIALLRAKSIELRSPTFLSIARSVSDADNLKAVRDLLDGLIGKLKSDDSAAFDHKAFCDQSLKNNAEKRDTALASLTDFNGKLAKGEATRGTLKLTISDLSEELQALAEAQQKADKLRQEEKKEHEEAIAEAKDGKDATLMAIQVLKSFYNSTAKPKPALVQKHVANASRDQVTKQPSKDAPDAGFAKNYSGSQAQSTAIFGMLEVIVSDMDRALNQTAAAEIKASKDYADFKLQTLNSTAEKTRSKQGKEADLVSLETQVASDLLSFTSQRDTLRSALLEAADLDKACNVFANFQDRRQKREKEIDELKKAIEFLNSA